MVQVRNTIRRKIADEQSGFMEGKDNTNTIYIVRSIIERALEKQNTKKMTAIKEGVHNVKSWDTLMKLYTLQKKKVSTFLNIVEGEMSKKGLELNSKGQN